MPNNNKRPWLIPGIIAIVIAIIGGIFGLMGQLPTTPTTPIFEDPVGDIDVDGNYIINWARSDRAGYYILEEDSDPSFANPRTVYRGDETEANILGRSDGDYYYRVRACNNAGNSGWSSSRRVTVMESPSPTTVITPTLSPTPTRKKIVNVSDAFYPGGWMGDWGDITFDDASTDKPHSEPTCIKVTYSAARSQREGWAGIYWQYPDKNWGNKAEGRDLTGATQLTFWARGENGGEKAEFKVGGITGEYPDSIQPPVSMGLIVLSDKWQQYTIDLAGKDTSHVIGGFCWVTNENHNPHGCTIHLDDIRYEWYE